MVSNEIQEAPERGTAVHPVAHIPDAPRDAEPVARQLRLEAHDEDLEAQEGDLHAAGLHLAADVAYGWKKIN